MIPQDGRMHVSRSGSRPGDAIADVLFALVMSDAMTAVDLEFQVTCPQMYAQHDLVPYQPVWADDACFPFWTDNNDCLTSVASTVARVVHLECSGRTLEPNYAAGKTECLLIPGSKGAMKLRKSLCVGDGRLAFDAFGSTHHVRLTSAYCHLGTTISDHLGAGFDMRKKLAKGLGTIRPPASKVLRRPDVSLKCRQEICLALGPTVAAFNCEVWGHLSLGDLHTWINGHGSMFRLLFKEDRHTHSPQYPTVYEVCGAAQLPVPQARLSIARILHAGRIVSRGVEPLWTLLALEDQMSPTDWLRILRQDLAWLGYWVEELSGVPFKTMSCDELAVWLSEQRLKTLVRRAWSAQTQTLSAWSRWQWEQRQTGDLHGVVGYQACNPWSEEVACPLCDFVARSGSQLAGHVGSAHGHINMAWGYIQGSTCRICLQQFWEPKRVLAHLNSETRCLALSVAMLQPHLHQELANLDVQGDDRREVQWAPAIRKAGPLRPVPHDVFERISCSIQEAYVLDRGALCKSARVLAKGTSSASELFSTWCSPPDSQEIESAAPIKTPMAGTG